MLTNCGDLYQKPQYSDKNPASFIMAKNPSILLTRFQIYQSSSLCVKNIVQMTFIYYNSCVCVWSLYISMHVVFFFFFLAFFFFNFYYPFFFFFKWFPLNFCQIYICTRSNVITILNIFKRKLTDFIINSLQACTCT